MANKNIEQKILKQELLKKKESLLIWKYLVFEKEKLEILIFQFGFFFLQLFLMSFLDIESSCKNGNGVLDLGNVPDEFEEDGFIVFDDYVKKKTKKKRKEVNVIQRKRKRVIVESSDDEDFTRPIKFPPCDVGRYIRGFSKVIDGRLLLVFISEAFSHRYIVIKGFTDRRLLYCLLDVPLQSIFDYYKEFDLLSSDHIQMYKTHYSL